MDRSFGRKIRDYRIDLDMSQKEMSSLIPMNQSNYSKIERGLQEPNIHQLKRIAEILNKSIDDLLDIDRNSIEENTLKNFQKEFDELYNKYFKSKKQQD
jgi:transcriptional regulator with XRE-family HTH domain